jgi:class 3 adenylate cyclase
LRASAPLPGRWFRIGGERPAVEVERILTTVLFTDVVGSAARAASLGEQQWRLLLDAHDRTLLEQTPALPWETNQ